jgi:4'-phosphopantetheinyl transferase
VKTVALHPWPGLLPQAGCELAVTTMIHPGSTDRPLARTRIRMALTDLCAGALGIDPGLVCIDSVPGKAPVLLVRGRASRAGISISHDGNRSIAAFHLHGPVGLDMMAVRDAPDWLQVATDYLAPATVEAIMQAPPQARPALFSRAWTAREASLKCLGLPLAEWQPGLDELASVELTPWPGWVGALAWR